MPSAVVSINNQHPVPSPPSSHKHGQGIPSGIDLLQGHLNQVFRFQRHAAGSGQVAFEHIFLEEYLVTVSPPCQDNGFFLFADLRLQILEQPVSVPRTLNKDYTAHGLLEHLDNPVDLLPAVWLFHAEYGSYLPLGNQIEVFSDGRRGGDVGIQPETGMSAR